MSDVFLLSGISGLSFDSSIYTAELRAILLALKHVYYSKEKSFLILSDSLSSLKGKMLKGIY